MEKIYLSQSSKGILKTLKAKQYSNVLKENTGDLLILEQEGLIKVMWSEQKKPIVIRLSDKGEAYVRENPALKNPISEEKKFWITSILSFFRFIR